jgi:hypothetical protein
MHELDMTRELQDYFGRRHDAARNFSFIARHVSANGEGRVHKSQSDKNDMAGMLTSGDFGLLRLLFVIPLESSQRSCDMSMSILRSGRMSAPPSHPHPTLPLTLRQ